jgi:3-dehydroquinate synthase
MHQINQRFTMTFEYPVCFTRGALDTANLALRNIFARAGDFPHKVQPVIDAEVLRLHPELLQQLEDYAKAHSDVMQLITPPLLVRGGETCKHDTTEVEDFYRLTQERSICRHSFALVVGGGSVIDAMGFAAAVTHRGVRLIRMPTTVLAQNDAGIGVKNAVNYRNRKNYLGTFAPPYAVLNDFDFLRTLPARDQRAGMAEAVKVALIRDRAFFDWMHAHRQELASFDDEAVEHMIVRCAELHLQHISTSGDPFEQGSARPLDFGHWAAHRLEELSRADLRHGEAVAIGIALDSCYSHAVGMLDEQILSRIIITLQELGFTLYHSALDLLDVHRALEDFREYLGGKLCITLLTSAGCAQEVDQIQLDVMQRCVQQLRTYARRDQGYRDASTAK